MKPCELIEFLHRIEPLKRTTRHAWMVNGRQESVAEHSWRLALMAMLLQDEIENVDFVKVIQMCLVHDFGEAVTGDIPAFWKTDEDSCTEQQAVDKLLSGLSQHWKEKISGLFAEMEALESREAKLWKALDQLEAVLQHNESPLSTWIPLEYEMNAVYGKEAAAEFEYTKQLQQLLGEEARRKAAEE